MDETIRRSIQELLDSHRIMTVATLRPDGWPQATTVGYVAEGLKLYFLCGPDSQKCANLTRDDRVSLAIDEDASDVLSIRGLSMAGHARRVREPGEVERIMRLLVARYPEAPKLEPMPSAEQVAVFEVVPIVISVLDYRKGFGHTDLVAC